MMVCDAQESVIFTLPTGSLQLQVPLFPPGRQGLRTRRLPIPWSLQQKGCWLDTRKHFRGPGEYPNRVTESDYDGCLQAGSKLHCLPEFGRRESSPVDDIAWWGGRGMPAEPTGPWVGKEGAPSATWPKQLSWLTSPRVDWPSSAHLQTWLQVSTPVH